VTVKPDSGNSHSWVEEGGADLRRYLLGLMSEAEEAGVERAYLGSEEALEVLRVREDELIEEYLANALEPAERERFERLFLASPARLERLVFLRALQDRVAKPPATRPAPSRPYLAWSAAAGLVVVVGVGLLVARAPRPAAVKSPVPPPSAAGSVASGPPVEAPPPPAAPRVVSLRLREPAVRGHEDVPLLDPGDAGQVVLEVPLDVRDAFTAHRGRVAAPDGSDAFVSPWQPNRGESTLRVVVPSASLRDGRHVLVVEGVAATGEETVESYAFRVRRR
jgi:hypothetical protein